MKILDRVTLVCVDCAYHGAAVAAIKKSMQQVSFARVVFISNIDLKIEGVDTIVIPKINSKEEYSRFCIKELYKYFDTDFVMVIQHDGFVICGEAWDDEFYNYDFIGAPWLYPDKDRNVGNGGASLRSYKLQKILGEDDFIEIIEPEDEICGRLYRRYLEKKYSIKYPSEDIADKFSFELRTPIQKTFAFHGRFHEPYRDMVIISRRAAMGDIIQTEPVLEYFHNKGYRVVLETLPQFEILFQYHRFPVLFPRQIDPRVLRTAKVYNLDMSYESDPKKLHLQSYFEFCGVSDYKLRKPKLGLGFEINEQTKLFKKLAILHIDNRAQPHRNIYDVDWKFIANYLEMEGYTVVQLGRDKTAEVEGITKMETVNENLLAYVCASADLFVGIDSGISHICSAFDVPCVIGFGSVNPEYIHPDLTNIVPIHNHNEPICDTPYCWSETIGCEGKDCYVNKESPPCTKFTTLQFINGINKIING